MVTDGAAGPEGTPGKRQFLVHIDADLIRQIKILALQRGVSASSLVQEAIGSFLELQPDAATARGSR